MNSRNDVRQFVTLALLLERAHAEHLRSVRSHVILLPTAQSANAIVEVTVITARGRFTAQGEASSTNVADSAVAAFPVSVANSRALARALRFALGVGVPAIEEISGEAQQAAANDNNGTARPTQQVRFQPPSPRPLQREASEPKATENQRKFLFRLLSANQVTGAAARAWVQEHLGTERVLDAPRHAVSKAIEELNARTNSAPPATGRTGS